MSVNRKEVGFSTLGTPDRAGHEKRSGGGEGCDTFVCGSV